MGKIIFCRNQVVKIAPWSEEVAELVSNFKKNGSNKIKKYIAAEDGLCCYQKRCFDGKRSEGTFIKAGSELLLLRCEDKTLLIADVENKTTVEVDLNRVVDTRMRVTTLSWCVN